MKRILLNLFYRNDLVYLFTTLQPDQLGIPLLSLWAFGGDGNLVWFRQGYQSRQNCSCTPWQGANELKSRRVSLSIVSRGLFWLRMAFCPCLVWFPLVTSSFFKQKLC